MKKADRLAIIQKLSSAIQEKSLNSKSGSLCLVISSSQVGKYYRVEVDADYQPVSCNCQGGRFNCLHKEAVRLYFAPRLAALLNSQINPVYQFYRAGKLVEARLSQFSKAEARALREQQAAQAAIAAAQAARRASYNALFDPNGIETCMYA